MKIAQIVCTFPPYRGGIGNSAYNIADALSDLGHEVTVFTPDYNYPLKENEFFENEGKFEVVRLKPLFKLGNAALVPQLFWKIKDFDIIHLYYPFYGALKPVLIRKLLSGRKMKLVFQYIMDSRAGGLKGAVFSLYTWLVLPVLARVSSLIACASLDYIKHSDLKKYYFKQPDRFRQILFGVNLEQFMTYRDGANRPVENRIILFVGGLDKAHYFKGLENLLMALAKLIKQPGFNKTILRVVGQGGLKNYYQERAISLGVAQSVEFYDKVDNSQLVDFYNYCDCLVLPSVNQAEAFGLVLLEAMACSKPVIASNLPGVRSVFRNGKQGLLVKPGDVDDLADKLKIILGDKKKAQAMGRAGRELVEKKYTWAQVAKRLDVIYHYVKYAATK